MLNDKLKALVDYIKSSITHFGDHGYFVNPLLESENGFEGITDQIESYFFIMINQPQTPTEYQVTDIDEAIFDFRIGAECFLIASFKNPNVYLAGLALLSVLKSYPDLRIEITDLSTDNEVIYKTLYDQQVDYKNQLFMITFSVVDHLTMIDNCDLDFCQSGC